MQYTLAEIGALTGAEYLQCPHPQALIDTLLFDSRQIATPSFALFFALAGPRHDGARYIPEAYRAGVRSFVLRGNFDPTPYPDANFLRVQNPLDALQSLAARHRRRFHIPVIGITGSNGKTIVKEWLFQLLQPDFETLRSPKSYNSQIGVPLSVWQLQASHQLAIFEAGISLPAEMARLEAVIQPDIGIFTNIGAAHREGFESKQAKLEEKMRLFENTALLIYCRDHEKIDAAARLWEMQKTARRFCSWSRRPASGADFLLENIQHLPDGACRFQVRAQDELTTLQIPFGDEASLENAMHCIVTARNLGLPMASIQQRLQHLEPVEMRLEIKAGINGCTVINDAYNNDLSALRIALQFAGGQRQRRAFTLILSDILQSGQKDEVLYPKVASAMQEQGVTRLIGIGRAVAVLPQYLPEGFDCHFYEDTEQFLQHFGQLNFQNEMILVKGARPFAFERVAERLAQKAHKTVLEVNLGALIHNLNTYRSRLKPGTRTMAMVKASGYGSGSAEVARLLEYHKTDYLGVAYADEGIELRHAGVNLPILVLNPEPASFDPMYRYRLEPEIYSLDILRALRNYTGESRQMAIHLKLDTGMHRLGFEAADVPALLILLQSAPNLHVQTIFSHLAASDAPEHDAFTHRQAETFMQLYTQICEGLGYRPMRHLANTGGIVRFPEYHFEMVRLGVGLYGVDSSGLADKLQVVNTLKATISQIKNLKAGETVGYNRNSGVLAAPKRIATISIGYADGFLRLAGRGQYAVQVHGQAAPTIGNVCMDMTMIDVSHIPQAREGDEVIVFGTSPRVESLAQCLQTIPYEVFTNISERVKRVYWQE